MPSPSQLEAGSAARSTAGSCGGRRCSPPGPTTRTRASKHVRPGSERYRSLVSGFAWLLVGLAVEAGTARSAWAEAPRPAERRVTPAPSSATPPTNTAAGEAERRSSYRFESGDICPFCTITPQFPEGHSGLHWHDHWSAVGTREYVTVPVLAAVALGTQLLVRREQAPDWNRPILFDRGARKLLRLESPSWRKAARTLSDVILTVSYAQPYLVDTLLVTWWARRAPRVAWQMFVINSQAFALTFALNAVTKRLTSRARPWVGPCDRDPTGESCGTGGRYNSFYSGHAALTATGAGLVCAHHTQLSLYANPTLDTATCVTAVLGTAVTGAMRIAADNHWASDVLVGHLMGYLSGYLLPTLLYYKEFRIAPHDDAPSSAPTFAVLPVLTPGSAQALVVGSF
jgi:membrane-associated phospholipid phosphatase